jgi:catalase
MTDKFPGTKTLTTSAGAPIADNQNAMTAGPLGPLMVTS